MSIQVHNVSKLFGIQKALDNVSFTINPGEIVGFLGPNGAGKSTMMKIITCFLPPTSGEIKVCGFNVINDSLEVRQKVGYLPESNPLYPDLYVYEFLDFIARIHKLGREKDIRIKKMIEITGLGPEQHKKIGALSKGYRQRVGLAQVLIHDPEVMILDEPTTGLDPNQIIEMRSLIKEIGKEKTIMLSTHIMQEVESICDRAIIISKGKVVADELTSSLHGLRQDLQVIKVEFDKKLDKTLILKIKGVTDCRQLGELTWLIRSNSKQDLRPEIFHFAVNHDLTVLSMNKTTQSIEEVFQALTKN